MFPLFFSMETLTYVLFDNFCPCFFYIFFYSDSLIRSRKLNYNYDLQEDKNDDTLDDNPSADTNPQTNTDNQDDNRNIHYNTHNMCGWWIPSYEYGKEFLGPHRRGLKFIHLWEWVGGSLGVGGLISWHPFMLLAPKTANFTTPVPRGLKFLVARAPEHDAGLIVNQREMP